MTKKQKPKKSPVLALILSLLVTSLGNFYVNTPQQRKVGFIYLCAVIALVVIATLIYVFAIPENDASLNALMDLIVRAIGIGLSVSSGLSARRAAIQLNQEHAEEN